MNEEKLITRQESAEMLSVSIRELDRIASCGKLHRIKMGRMTKFSHLEVMNLVEEIRQTGRRTWNYKTITPRPA